MLWCHTYIYTKFQIFAELQKITVFGFFPFIALIPLVPFDYSVDKKTDLVQLTVAYKDIAMTAHAVITFYYPDKLPVVVRAPTPNVTGTVNYCEYDCTLSTEMQNFRTVYVEEIRMYAKIVSSGGCLSLPIFILRKRAERMYLCMYKKSKYKKASDI